MGQYAYQPQPQPYQPAPQPYQPPKSGIPPQVFFIGAAVVIIMLITLGIVFFMWPSAKAPLKFDLSSVQSSVDQGSSLVMSQYLPAGNEPTLITYKASHLTSKQVVAEKTESIPAQDPIPSSFSLSIPQTASPGQYVLTAVVKRGPQQTQSQFSFRIRRSVVRTVPTPTTPPIPGEAPSPVVPVITPLPDLECPDGCNDYNQCTLDRCVDGACEYDPFTPCCGNNACESGETQDSCPQDCAQRGFQKSEVVTEITNRAIAASGDTQEAVTICRTLSKSYDTDQCVKEIATLSKDYNVCMQITSIDDKDTCLLDQAIDNENYVACEHVQNRWLQDSCYHYKRLKELE